jgi:hypothetical protein
MTRPLIISCTDNSHEPVYMLVLIQADSGAYVTPDYQCAQCNSMMTIEYIQVGANPDDYPPIETVDAVIVRDG